TGSRTSRTVLSGFEPNEVTRPAAGREVVLEDRQTLVDVAQVADPSAQLRALGRDRRAELVGHLVAAALGPHPGPLPRLGQRQVELPQSGQEAKAFDVGLAVPAVSGAVSGGLSQE